MKIIHILLGKANPKTTMNGVNVVVDRYAGLMYEQGYDVEVWGIADNPITNLPSPKYPIRFFQQHHSWPLKLDSQLVKCLESLDTASTLIHFHGGFIREFPKIAEMVKGLKYFVMPHGVYAKNCFCRKWWLKLPYWTVIEKRFVNNSKGLLLLHKSALYRKIAKSLNDASIYVIPNGADPHLVATERKNEPVGKDEPIVWGYCGRIDDAHKGIHLMVRSFIRFARQCSDGRHILSIIGDGPDLNDIRKRYATEIDSGIVQLHGKLFEVQKFEKLREMRFFFHLSNWDGVPLACLDALAMWIPLIVTPGTNLADDIVCYGAGVATLPETDAVVRNMQKLANADRQNLVKGCTRLLTEKYNWKISCDKLISLYETALCSDYIVDI